MKKIKENIILINTIIYLIFYEIIFITLKGGNLQNIILKVLFDVQIAFIISILANIFNKKINNIIYLLTLNYNLLIFCSDFSAQIVLMIITISNY